MTNWKKVGIDLGTGAVAGAADQGLKYWDSTRPVDTPWYKKAGTYFNFGVPLLAVGAVAMNKLQGDWATRALVVGGQLAGRHGTALIIKKAKPEAVPYNAVRWSPVHQDLPSPVPPAPISPIAPHGDDVYQGARGSGL